MESFFLFVFLARISDPAITIQLPNINFSQRGTVHLYLKSTSSISTSGAKKNFDLQYEALQSFAKQLPPFSSTVPEGI